MRRLLLIVVAFSLGCARYDYPQPTAGGRNIRVDRISGRTEVLTRTGWRALASPAPPFVPLLTQGPNESPCSSEEMKEVHLSPSDRHQVLTVARIEYCKAREAQFDAIWRVTEDRPVASSR